MPQHAAASLLPARADKLSFENDDGTIMAEEIFQEQLLSYRPVPPPTQLPDCPEPSGPSAEVRAAEPAPAAAAAAAKPAAKAGAPARGAGSRPAAAGKPAGGAAKSNAAAEARAKQLGGEAEVRAKVVAVRDELSRGLAALAALAAGDRAFTAEKVGVYVCLFACGWVGGGVGLVVVVGGGGHEGLARACNGVGSKAWAAHLCSLLEWRHDAGGGRQPQAAWSYLALPLTHTPCPHTPTHCSWTSCVPACCPC